MKTTTKTVWATNQERELLIWSPDEKNFVVPVLSLNRGELIELGEAIKDALERTSPLSEAAATKEGGAP